MAFGSSGFYRSGSSITDMLTTNNASCGSARDHIDTRKESTRLFTQLQQDIAALQGYVDAKIDSLVASSSGSSSESNGKLPLDLSRNVKHLHQSGSESMQFDGKIGYDSPHNEKVAVHLTNEIMKTDTGKNYSPKDIKKAVHRYYESRRRIIRDESEERLEQVKKNKERRNKTEKQKKLLKQRTKFIKANEADKWKDITYKYMSDESEAENGVIKHTPVWRSRELNKQIRKLDKRRLKAMPTNLLPSSGPVRSGLPPSGAPLWALEKSFAPVSATPPTTPSTTPTSTTPQCMFQSTSQNTPQQSSQNSLVSQQCTPQSMPSAGSSLQSTPTRRHSMHVSPELDFYSSSSSEED